MSSRPSFGSMLFLVLLTLLLLPALPHFVSAQSTIQTLQSAVQTNVTATKAGLANILGYIASVVGLILSYMAFHKGFIGKDWGSAGAFTIGAVVSFGITALLQAF